jgi:hypothetical protein
MMRELGQQPIFGNVNLQYQNRFQVRLSVNLSQPRLAPSRRPIPERIGHAKTANEISRSVDTAEAIENRSSLRQAVDKHHRPCTVSSEVKPEARSFSEHAHLTGISCVKRAVAIAQAADKSTARLFAKNIAVRQAPLTHRHHFGKLDMLSGPDFHPEIRGDLRPEIFPADGSLTQRLSVAIQTRALESNVVLTIFAAIRRASSLVSSLAGLVRRNATKHSAEEI